MNSLNQIVSVVGTSLLLGVPAVASKAKNVSDKPNVIMIYADDLGAGLLGCYGQKIIKTPNIDRLAKEGMQFGHSHGCMYCAPARASLITGLHDSHKGAWTITRGGHVIKRDQGKMTEEEFVATPKKGIQAKLNEVFLAQVAQNAGYKTAQFGKLDWGFATSHEKLTRHGWDYYLGYMDHQRAHGFYPTYLWLNGEKLPLPGNECHDAGKTKESGYDSPEATKARRDKTGKKTYSQNVFIEHVLKYIEDNKNDPFFIYHSTQLPHGPVDIPEVYPDFVNDDRLTAVEKEYASMVKMLDNHVGLIMDKLKKLGLDKKTMVVFTADNGHELYYVNNKGRGRKRSHHGEIDIFKGAMDLAGLKWTNWQGGIRVPLIVRWPGKIKVRAKSRLLTAGYDYMPTFAEVMGGTIPDGKDGVSFLPTLLGKKQKAHDYIIVNNAVITKDWKLVKHKKELLLFNLKKDPGERTDLATKCPEKLKELKLILDRELGSQRKDL